MGGFVLGIILQKRCFKIFILFFHSQDCVKNERTLRMDEFTHKMEDSTMKQKTPILEHHNPSLMQQETKI
jgi:hypothetical protein